MVGSIIGNHKGGDQGTVVAFSILIHVSELTTTTEVDFHWRLIMGRCEPLSPLCTASLQDQTSVLGRHPGAEAVRFSSASVIGLESPFGHKCTILPSNETIRLNASPLCVKKRGDRNEGTS